MRNVLFWIGLVAVLVVPNLLIAEKESIAHRGRLLYLELAPVDPRSLLQGDYMDLRYQITRSAREGSARGGSADWPRRGQLVLKVDERGIGSFVRRQTDDAPVGEEEQLLRFHRRGRQLLLGLETYFFQEGQGGLYANARYGELRVLNDGRAVLVALCDQELKRLGS